MWIFILVLIALILPLVISHNSELYRRHKGNSNGIVNHSANLREFWYRVDKSSDEIWKSLKSHNTPTSISYRLNEADSTIVFYSDLPDGYLDVTYGIYIFEREGYSILKVVQQNHFWEKNKYAFLQNEFWNKMLGAAPIPYTDQPM